MSRRYFGTDGVRGEVGKHPMTAEFALRLANAAAQVLAPDGGSVMIGKDTRVSGYMFESALEAGFVAAGVDVMLLGPLPTPGIAFMTRSFSADLGVVISASHNPFYDNGIKFFDRNGSKLSDDVELAIERLLDQPSITRESQRLGRARRVDTSRVRYQDFCKDSIKGVSLDGLRIVLDCSNGAGYKVAPRILNELGAQIIPIGCSPNGRNINDTCGSTHPELLQKTVVAVDADMGIALDGDGDRLVMVDNLGNLIDGDQLIYIIARARAQAGRLSGPVVGTVMSNLGLERALQSEGIAFVRAKVGDRYVIEQMQRHGASLGGESSGHLICLDKTTTGDGIISALQILAIVRSTGRPLNELAAEMPIYPQCMINVRVEQRFDPGESAPINAAVEQAERALAERGRIVLRASGTEPVIRVMVEGEDESEVRTTAESLADVVRSAAA
ncbi:MAG: phosphoglucosamine mutase [Pseudomonadota bacterium]